MYDITADNASNFDFFLSDGTPVTFVKITSKNNIQVRLPDSHPDAYGQENGRIFRRDGSHYTDTLDVTLSATPKEANPAAPATTPGNNPFVALLSSLTPVADDGKFVIRDSHVYELVLRGELAA